MPAETAAGKLPLGSLLLILVIVFINFAGFSLIIPLLPFYGRELGASAVEVTMLFAAYSFGGIFGEIFWGRSSDRLGRKRILILTTACAAVSYVAFAFAATFWLALGIRIVTGFFSGTIGVCQSYIADVTTPQERARSIGYLGAALNLGFVIGPALGGLLAAPIAGIFPSYSDFRCDRRRSCALEFVCTEGVACARSCASAAQVGRRAAFRRESFAPRALVCDCFHRHRCVCLDGGRLRPLDGRQLRLDDA
jgi:hypothetical protein